MLSEVKQSSCVVFGSFAVEQNTRVLFAIFNNALKKAVSKRYIPLTRLVIMCRCVDQGN